MAAPRPVDIDDDRVAVDGAGADPEDVLLEAAGASLVHDGGPLSPARPMIRGLSGARLGVDVGGLDLSDPSTGLLDAAMLPWSAASSLVIDTGAAPGEGEGGALHLSLLRGPALRARVLTGSLSTARLSVAAAGADALVAFDAGVTRGDFAFRPTSAVAAPAGFDAIRTDNDQRRASLLGAARARAGDVDVDALAFAAAHDGGIAGMATSPTHGLRGEDALAGARAAFATRAASGARISLVVDGRASHRATFGPQAPRSAVESAGGAVQAGVASMAMGTAHVDVDAGVDGASLVGADAPGRLGASARVRARAPLGPVRLRAVLDGRALSDAGPLFSGELRAEAGGILRGSVGVSRASRAPTLDELYAPRGLVLGNPALRPEAVDDVEAAVAFAPGRVLEAKAVGFAGMVEDGIAYVNRNAFEIAPENLGPAWRAGIDISLSVEPSPWCGLEAVGEALASEVAVTRAPLPLAPPFSSRIAVRAGPRAGAPALTAVLRSRGAAASNAFGTLKAAPYHLVDLLLRWPLGEHLALGASLDNALDARDARDANQMPLPGRLLFFSLEVRG